MSISLWSFFMAVIWCDIFILLSILFTRWNRFVRCNISSIIILAAISTLRLSFTYELPFAKVIRSEWVFPVISNFLRKNILEIEHLGINVSIVDIFLFIWLAVSISLFFQFSLQFKKESKYILNLPRKRDFYSEALLQSILKDKDKDKIIIFRSSVKIPFLHGVFKPTIYLPDYYFNDKELHAFLRHEYNHYVYKDIVVKILIKCFCIVFWWNPMVYFLKANLNHALEVKCDINIINDLSEQERISYLESIIRIIKLGKGSITKVTDGCAGMVSVDGKNLEQRFKVVLKYKKPGWKTKLSKTFFYTVMVLLLFISFLFVLQPYTGDYTGIAETSLIGVGGGEHVLTIKGAEDNGYLIDNKDGSYSVYVDGNLVGIFNDIPEVFLESLPILQIQEDQQ